MINKTKQSEAQKIPKLRFAGFLDEWEERRLGEVSKTFSGGTPTSTNSSYYLGEIPLIKSGEISKDKTAQFITEKALNNSSAKLVKKGDLLYALYGATSGEVAISKIVGAINQAVLCIRIDENIKFIHDFLRFKKKRILATYLQGGQGNLSADIVKNLKITFPLLPEQQKIAGFLGTVDEWVENLRAQKENLEDYKKGMMQKIFSQEVRFKNDEGNNFAEWEEKKLEDIGKSFSGLTGKSGEDFGSGEPFITYKQIFDDSKININKFALVSVGANEKQNKAQFGDIFFTTSSETPLEVGFASVLLDKDIDPYLNSFSFGFRPNSLKEFNPYYARFFFRSSIFRKEVVKLAQGSTRYNISKLSFMKIKVLFPSFPEQQKIAEFLTLIDNLINSKQQQITQAEEWKKGLMQGLFV